MDQSSSPLPYLDVKPQGAADFYFAINATFRFVFQRFGIEGLRDYWTDLGQRYFVRVSERWKRGGLQAVADYWRAFFAAEPGSDVEVNADDESVTVSVRVCPAIAHLRKSRREIIPCFCQHCFFVGEAMSARAGLTVRIEGGNGSCRQRFLCRDVGVPSQDLGAIREVASC